MSLRTGVWIAISLASTSLSLAMLLISPPSGILWIHVAIPAVGLLAIGIWVRVATLEISAKRRGQSAERDLCERLMVIDYENTARRVCRCGHHKLK